MHNSKIAVKLEENCLKPDKVSFTYRNVISFFIVDELDIWSRDLSTDFTLKDCLLGLVKLTKSSDPYKYSYPECSIGFDSRSFVFHFKF